MVGPNLPFGGLACGLVLGPLPSRYLYSRRRICHRVKIGRAVMSG